MAKVQEVNLQVFEQQDDFIRCQSPYSAFIGGVGSGKTVAGAIKALSYVVDHPGSLGFIGAPSFPMLRDATLRSIRELFPQRLVGQGFNRSEMTLSLTNGSEILLRSCDDPEHLRGPTLAWFWIDEGARVKRDAWLVLQGRLRQAGYPLQGWVTTTPKGFNWVYQEFDQRERENYRAFHCSARQNPFLQAGVIELLEESYGLSSDFALQEIEGKYVVVGGKCYFPMDRLRGMLDDCSEPVSQEMGGVIRIWKPPVVAGRYVAGGDLCWGETGAYSVLIVLDWQTGEQVAEIYGRLPEDEMAQLSVELCSRYNHAFAGVEANGEGINVVNKMIELGYGKYMFYQANGKPGWLTSASTRPVMLGELEEAVRNLRVRPRCRDLVSELMSFIRNDTGRAEASEGAYDDHVFALSIAWQMRKFASWQVAGKAFVVKSRGAC